MMIKGALLPVLPPIDILFATWLEHAAVFLSTIVKLPDQRSGLINANSHYCRIRIFFAMPNGSARLL
jgi:hypothetical protein